MKTIKHLIGAVVLSLGVLFFCASMVLLWPVFIASLIPLVLGAAGLITIGYGVYLLEQ